MRDTLNHAAPYFHETHINVSGENAIFVRSVRPSRTDVTTPVVLYASGYRDDMNNIKCQTAQAAALESGATFVTLDYRGHGASRGPVRNESLTAYTDDIKTALKEIAPNAEKLFLIGHSIGFTNVAFLADDLEKEKPGTVAGIIGIAPVPALMAKGRLGHKICYTRGGRQELKETGEMTNFYAPQLVYSRDFLHDYRRRSLVSPRNRRLLQQFEFPVHMILAAKDAFSPLIDIEHVARHLQSAKIIICDKAKHVMEDDESLAAIGTAIRELLSHTTAHAAPAPA